jgi:hypothetical protein
MQDRNLMHIFDRRFLSFEQIRPKVIFATKINVWVTNNADINSVDFKPVKKVKKIKKISGSSLIKLQTKAQYDRPSSGRVSLLSELTVLVFKKKTFLL